jgi:serine/threonine protein phosphatase PrpC
MPQTLWSYLRTRFGPQNAWGAMTLSRVCIDPISARSLTQVLRPAHTIRLRPEPEEEHPKHPLELGWHGVTDTGTQRPQNEDSFALLDLGIRSLFVVADGMGGHDAGEVASSIAVDAVCSELRKDDGPASDPLELVDRAIRRANSEVKREGTHRGSNMGTTLTVALVADGVACIGSVGDSRAYWIGNDAIRQITEDHSMVAKLVASGKLTQEEARGHPRANLLYRTIGNDDAVIAGLYRVELQKGGTLLLCTDGLWGEVSDEDLHRICAEETRTEVICARLVQLANANGGRDNITAIVVRVN